MPITSPVENGDERRVVKMKVSCLEVTEK